MRFHTKLLFLLLFSTTLTAHALGYWHGVERTLRYTPVGEDIVIVNGSKRFNRALYGTNTAFRVEAGDLPEFGLFMPNMGGNIQFGLLIGTRSLWLKDAQNIKSIYRSGSQIYEIQDPILEQGEIVLTLLAMSDAEGVVFRVESKRLPKGTELLCVYGGANDKRFSRNGDLGVDDPEGFSLKPENCMQNSYQINDNRFVLAYAPAGKGGPKRVVAVFPKQALLKEASPYKMTTPAAVWSSSSTENKPIVLSKMSLDANAFCYLAFKKEDNTSLTEADLERSFTTAESARKGIAQSVSIETPDAYFNPLGGVLSMAADGIWDNQSWQHGAIGWRMPLSGWRGAYVGDAIGWHSRSKTHFDGYAASQITTIEPTIAHPSQDTQLNLARANKQWGTQMYSNGYICRNPYETNKMHHYDMNLCYIDELLWHFNWTGDWAYVKQMWPVLKRHLAWEKRNFDPNNDGLYDAYASIWASDALQYNSGGVTHASALNYRANKMAAQIAKRLGEDAAPYQAEADQIYNAINANLWIERSGWWAEYKDYMGNKLLHPSAGLWTVYHAIDSDIHTPFQAYQATRYVDTEIPHIPVLARGLEDEGYQTISTTNWLPYSWSINNVAFAEVAHTALAYWQSGRFEEAFKLFKSSLLDGMYLGGSPGNIGQVSFYDAARGECYRDFADPVGVYSRVLIQGLFGILPDAMNNRLLIRPGFPAHWSHASLATADVELNFNRSGSTDTYAIKSKFTAKLSLELELVAQKDRIKNITVNGSKTPWSLLESIDHPRIKIRCDAANTYQVVVEWAGDSIKRAAYPTSGVKGEEWKLSSQTNIKTLFDPQQVLNKAAISKRTLNGTLAGELGHRTLFVQLTQGEMTWWQPILIQLTEPFEVASDSEAVTLTCSIKNRGQSLSNGTLIVNPGTNQYTQPMDLKQGESKTVSIPTQSARLGTNRITLWSEGKLRYATEVVNWNLKNNQPTYEAVNIDRFLNASVSQIFTNQYLTPRSPYTTLQVPIQGIGEWCHPTLTADIDDSGIRKAVKNELFSTPFGVPFRSTGDPKANNIAFTTLWDNYPDQILVPLTGNASHLYLLMAGTTNHMQCHIANGLITVQYRDKTTHTLRLINPETWVPIEQDLYLDGAAFQSKQPRPYRVAFKSGLVSRDLEKELDIKGVYGRSIPGGAGIILDLPLDPDRELESLTVKSVANEVLVGLMSITLVR